MTTTKLYVIAVATRAQLLFLRLKLLNMKPICIFLSFVGFVLVTCTESVFTIFGDIIFISSLWKLGLFKDLGKQTKQ